MKKLVYFVLLFGLFACNISPESGHLNNYQTESNVSEVLHFLESNKSDSSTLNTYWQELKDTKRIPFTHKDTALFLYKGAGTSVSWQGDFSGWGQNSSVTTKGTRIGSSDIFYLKHIFPSDARLDYKIVVDSNWILDPNNPNQQWSGFGPNSELKMPDYKDSPYKNLQSGVKAGNLSSTKTISSVNLGYTVGYKVWLPADYDSSSTEPYKMLYVTDGQEYADSRLGALQEVAANLMHDKKIQPFIMVFISPLNPSNPGQNRRTTEYVLNASYSKFLVDELIPAVESVYHVSGIADDRAILGTSLGGLHSAYILATESESFKRIGIHSPAFWYKKEIFDLVKSLNTKPNAIYMTTGTISDTEEDADKMRSIFDDKSWNYGYKKVNEGHSWGNWSGTMDEMLIGLFPEMNTSIES
jgi:enterochelin esterase-like enzyme